MTGLKMAIINLSLVLNNLGWTTFVVAVTCVVLWEILQIRQRRGFPPGPRPLPVLGNVLLFLRDRPEEVLQKLAQTYGDIFTIEIFIYRMVVINSFELNKKAFSRDEFSGRPDLSADFGDVYPSNAGIVDAEGDIWKTNRKFCLRHLGDMGFGKKKFEAQIMLEVRELVGELERKTGQNFNPHAVVANSVSNIICGLVFGKRYEYDDAEFLEYLHSFDTITNNPFLSSLVPGAQYIPGVRSSVTKFLGALRKTDDIISKHIEKHQEEKKSGLGDIIAIYLDAKQNMGESSKILDSTVFEDIHIRKTAWDLFIAGTETTASTLRWAVAHLVNFPDIQEKLRCEIHQVVGSERDPTLADKPQMPYTQAFLAELQRIVNLVPFAEFHRATVDVAFEGYRIPKDTNVISHLYGVNMNESNFPNPKVFRPERFLDSDGSFKKSLADLTIPFGIGKRVCLGESLARMELFLFLTTIVQRFAFSCATGESNPTLERNGHFINAPGAFNVHVTSI